jgi:hypothetical protein
MVLELKKATRLQLLFNVVFGEEAGDNMKLIDDTRPMPNKPYGMPKGKHCFGCRFLRAFTPGPDGWQKHYCELPHGECCKIE